MKRLMIAAVMTCALSTQIVGGEIPSGGIAPPPPSSAGLILSSDLPSAPDQTQNDGSGAPVSDVGLSTVLIVLGWLPW
jgi:hypothetical protein